MSSMPRSTASHGRASFTRKSSMRRGEPSEIEPASTPGSCHASLSISLLVLVCCCCFCFCSSLPSLGHHWQWNNQRMEAAAMVAEGKAGELHTKGLVATKVDDKLVVGLWVGHILDDGYGRGGEGVRILQCILCNWLN